MLLDLLILDPPGPSALEQALREALREQLRHAMDPSGASISGVTMPARCRISAMYEEISPGYDAALAALEPAAQEAVRRDLALLMTPVMIANGKRAPGQAAGRADTTIVASNLLREDSPATVALGLRLGALGLRAAGQRQEASAALEAAIAWSRARGDRVGEGLGWLQLGELRAAPDAPLLSRERWLMEHERGTQHVSGTPWIPAPGDDEAARKTWSKADPLLMETPWGPGLLALHRGVLEARAGRVAEALSLLREATAALDGPGPPAQVFLAQAARTHLALAEIGAGGAADPRVARAIGAWGAQESPSYALGLAMIALGWAWDALEDHGESAQAVLAARCAVDVLEGLGEPRPLALARLALADLCDFAYGTGASLPALEEVWELGISLQDGPMDADGLEICTRALAATLSLLLGGHQADALERLGPRQQLLRGWRDARGQPPDPRLDWAIFQPRLPALLSAIGRARDEGDEDGLERALCALEDEAARAPEPDRWLWRATALAWRERKDEALEQMLRFVAWVADTPLSPEVLERSELVAPELREAMQRALLVQQERDAAQQRLRAAISCERWDRAMVELEGLWQRWGPTGWMDEGSPWEAPALEADVLDGVGRLDEAALAWERAWEATAARRVGARGDAGQRALAAGEALPQLARGGERTALSRHELALARGDQEAARRLLEEAFRWSERARAAGLNALLAARQAPLPDAAHELMRRWTAARARLDARSRVMASLDDQRRAALEARIQQEEEALDALETELCAALPPVARLLDTEPITLAGLSAALPPGSALLALDAYDRGLVSWFVPASGPPRARRVRLPLLRLASLARRLHRACSGGGEWRAPAADLSALILDPLDEALAACSRLLIVTSGPLHRVPWAVLPWRGAPLAQTHALSLIPSATTLRWLRPDQPVGLERALIVGNPAGMAWTAPGTERPTPLPSLPGAADEARALARQIQGSRPLLGEAATGAAVRAQIPQAGIVHLATHGHYEPASPLLSGLMLAHGEVLDLATLLGLELQAALVVLSACESGLGAWEGGEPIGLPRGLLAAGAGGVVASLWPVDDQATVALMSALYAGLAQGLPAAEALRRAMLDAREQARVGSGDRDILLDEPLDEVDPEHPRLWAPFVLFG